MSMTSNSESARSAAEIRRDIADYVLKHIDELSGVSGVKEFVEEHGRLTKEIAQAEERQERLAKAKEDYEPLEQRVASCRKALKDADAKLAKLHHPLGKSAFEAFLDGIVPTLKSREAIHELPAFTDRIAAHKRVQELVKEHGDLAPASDAGMAQKAKAKSQQLVITGKIKIAEMKFGGLETEIGRKIIESELDEAIQHNMTVDLLDQIKLQRDGIAKFSLELKGAENERIETAKRISETVELARFDSTKELDAANNLCAKGIRQHNFDLDAATRALAAAFQEVNSSALPNDLTPCGTPAVRGLLNSLATAKEQTDLKGDAKRYMQRVLEAGPSAKRYWVGLNSRTKIATSVVVGVIILGMFVLPGARDNWIGILLGMESSELIKATEEAQQAVQKYEDEKEMNARKYNEAQRRLGEGLTVCPDCRNKVSIRAETCVHCGRNL